MSTQATQTNKVQTKPSRPFLPIVMGDVNNQNINLLRKINYDIIPVKYSTQLYIKIANEYTKHSKFAYYNDIIIGGYTTRLQDFKDKQHAYILTFGVLEPYRKYSIGRQMMEALEKDITKNTKASGIYLHMHVLNDIGKKFYESQGFHVHEKLENYYTDLEEPHCYILLKNIVREGKVDKKEEEDGK